MLTAIGPFEQGEKTGDKLHGKGVRVCKYSGDKLKLEVGEFENGKF